MKRIEAHPLARLGLPSSPMQAVREGRASTLEVAVFYVGLALLATSYGTSIENWSDAIPLAAFCWLILIGYCVALGNLLPWGPDKKGTSRSLEVTIAIMLIMLVPLANPIIQILPLMKAASTGQCARMVSREWTLCLSEGALFANAAGCLVVIIAFAATLRSRMRSSAIR